MDATDQDIYAELDYAVFMETTLSGGSFATESQHHCAVSCGHESSHCAYVWVQQSSTALLLYLDVLLRAAKEEAQPTWEHPLRVKFQDNGGDGERLKVAPFAGPQSGGNLFRSKVRSKDAEFSMSFELAQVALTASAFALVPGLPAKPMSSLFPNARDRGLYALACLYLHCGTGDPDRYFSGTDLRASSSARGRALER
ncbi:hypothetical protein CERZMDRAFT_101814 [Cercospora zeae-maydis SCOH1-5]|uniref:Uncharacterized protein n=1 Tax=Cercospora zeae-maydis SCOH1-5 TaxID=717836 RepID=A0A6A6F6A5_9PEZI|nr:hypothetical protein CERZMDRAFT_101814 [Cercospora zeae-maydis SCOH1-5]